MKNWDEAYKEIGIVQTGMADLIKEAVKLFKKHKVRRVLDLGFGTGRHTVFLAEQGLEVYGMDISEKGKEITEGKLKEKGLKANLQIADMHKLPYQDNFFDAVVAIYVIEHNTLKGLKESIAEIRRALKPGGVLVATLISTKDPRHGTGKEIEPNTFVNFNDPVESDVMHRTSDKKEAKKLFGQFNILKLEEMEGFSPRRKMKTFHWEIIVKKMSN